MIGRRYMPPAVMGIQYQLFSRNSKRGFKSGSKPLFEAVNQAKSSIRKAKSLEDVPPFTDIALEYGALLTQGILTSFVKGYDASRKRRLRKNSINVEDLVKFDWNLQNTAAVAAFSREAFIMAGVQTEELRSALFEEAKAIFASGGTYRDWADTFSMHGFEPDNPYHLRTNYDTAASAAYSAGQWEQINENKDVFPYLRYVTMQDEKVREEHWMLHDLIYPVDDPFWDNYMPPNGWNCRCSVEQLMQSELPKDYSPMPPNAPVMVDPKFMNNPGKAIALLYIESLNAKQIPWDEAGFPPMKGHPIETPPHLNHVSGLSEEQLSALYAKSLASRTVFDVNHVPLVINVEKADKLSGYPLKSLRSRVKYIASLDDVLKHPHEVWLQPDNHNRVFYIKRYASDVVIIAEIEKDGVFRYFDIMTSSNVTSKVRSGVPIYLKR